MYVLKKREAKEPLFANNITYFTVFSQPPATVSVKTKSEKKKTKSKTAPDDVQGWSISNARVVEVASQECNLRALLEFTSEVQCNIAATIKSGELSTLQADEQDLSQQQDYDLQFSLQFVLHRI